MTTLWWEAAPSRRHDNQRLATATALHDLYGIPLGRVCEQIGLGPEGLVEIFHRMAGLSARIPNRLVVEHSEAAVKYAKEAGWQTNGHHGDA